MKKIVSVLLSLVMVLSLTACGKDSSTGSSTPTPADTNAETNNDTPAEAEKDTAQAQGDAEKKTIGISMNALDEYQTEWLGYLKEYLEGQGHTVISTNAEGKVDKQLSDVESLIALNPEVIIIRATDSEGVVPAFEACEAAGIPTVDSGFGAQYEDTLKILSSQFYLCSLQAQYCIDWLEAHPDETLKVGYIWGVQGVSAVQDRYDGWKETLMEAYPDRVEILVEKVCNWSAVDTMAAVEDWLQAYPEMNCIIAQSDEMAIAASNVMQAANKGLDQCIIIGIDGSPNARQCLADQTLSASVYTSKKADAILNADYAIEIANGENYKGMTIDPGENISALITGENYQEVLDRIG